MGEGTTLIRRRALGDVVLLGSIAGAVPGPVRVVTDARYVPLVRRMRGVDEAVPWGAARSRGQVIDLQRSTRTLWRYPSARKVRKHSVARRLRLWGVGHGRPRVTALYAAACRTDPLPPPWFDVPKTPRETLALVPGASRPLKAADPDVLVEIGRLWEGPVAVLGGPGEDAIVRRVARRIPGAYPLVDEGFDATLVLLAGSRVVVGGDTGLVHLAVGCGAAVVVLAGPTHPDDGFLRGERYSVLGRDLACRPCALHRVHRCRLGHAACRDHRAQDVWQAVQGAACAGSS